MRHQRRAALLAGALTLSSTLAACASGEPVALRTDASGNCFLSFIEGQLVPDPSAGTAIIEASSGHRWYVMWPAGYTGRRVGSEIEIVSLDGRLVFRTGTDVHLDGGYTGDGGWLACPFEPAS
jgi:hypothetical protein